MVKLGVNIDHVATVRQARKEGVPDLVLAAKAVLAGGADGLTIHLREDRRHIQDKDVLDLRALDTSLNLEMAATDEMVAIAKNVKPDFCCLVPEKREELTTEGGLDVVAQKDRLRQVVSDLNSVGIKVSLFIDTDSQQIEAASAVGADIIELHTGHYANATMKRDQYLIELKRAAVTAHNLGLVVNAGHGLDYDNVRPILELPHLNELNIGFSLVARSLFVGLESAVSEMKSLF